VYLSLSLAGRRSLATTPALPATKLLRSMAALACMLLLLPGLALAGERVYRCTGSDGKTTFQGQPCAGVASPPAQAAPPRRASVPESPRLPHSPASRPAPRADLPATPAPDMAQWADGADVVVVSGYAPSSRVTQVEIAHTARPVLLVLTSYEDTLWKVVPSANTRIRAVVFAGSASSARGDVLAPPGVPVHADTLPYASALENIHFRELLKKLNTRYGVERVAAFRGAYKLPAQVMVQGPFAPDPRLTIAGVAPEAPTVRFGFDLVSVDGRRLPFTNTGPRDGKRYTGIVRGGMLGGGPGAAAVREDGREAYYLEGNGSTLVWAPEGLGGRKEKLVLPPHLPPLSWGAGMAWDTRKGVLAIVSFGGEGYFYRYDTRRRQWIDARSLQHRDLASLALDPQTGGYLSLSSRNLELVRFNERGELEEVQSLKDLLVDVDSTYDKGNRPADGLAVVTGGAGAGVVNVTDGTVTHIWTLDSQGRKAQLTYKAGMP